MKRKVLRALELILAAVFVVSLVMVLRTRMEYTQGASVYEEAAAAAEVPVLKTAPAVPAGELAAGTAVSDPNLRLLAEMNLAELQQQNADVLGWISIPETVLSYPLLQGSDNDFYLKHTWRQDSSIVGAVFMDYRSDAALTDFNTIIYGHRMRDGSMFASLKDYLTQEYWEAHPSVYLACDSGVYRYDVFAAYEASVLGHVYDLSDRDAEGKEEFIAACLEQSDIRTGIVPTADDYILTLSTCTGRGYRTRWVVQAVQTEFLPADE